MIERITDIKDLVSYSFRVYKTKFYFNIMLTRNQRTANLKDHHFARIYENDFEISPEKLSPIRQLEFPTQNDINTQKRKALMRQFDDSHSEKGDDEEDIIDLTSKKWYYAVRIGHKTGIYTTWDDCKLATHYAKGATYKKFPTRELAIHFLNSNTPNTNTPLNRNSKRSKTSFSDTANTFTDSQLQYIHGSNDDNSHNSYKTLSKHSTTSNNDYDLNRADSYDYTNDTNDTNDNPMTSEIIKSGNNPNDPSRDYLFDICPKHNHPALLQIIDSGYPLESVHDIVLRWLEQKNKI